MREVSDANNRAFRPQVPNKLITVINTVNNRPVNKCGIPHGTLAPAVTKILRRYFPRLPHLNSTLNPLKQKRDAADEDPHTSLSGSNATSLSPHRLTKITVTAIELLIKRALYRTLAVGYCFNLVFNSRVRTLTRCASPSWPEGGEVRVFYYGLGFQPR